MTLYRQIAISIIVLCILGFLGTVTISTNNMRSFLVTQLESHAQDTATSLGLSLSEPMRTEDMPVIQSMIDAIFDRGYYRDIKLVATGGETLIERSTRSPGNLVPEWFATAIPLRSPTAEAIVMAGWKQAARIHVTSHPGNAYSELWSNTVDTFRLFLVAATVILALALLAVKYLLRPLYRVEQQADAICNRSYPVQEKLPRTRELRRVVTAMNRLSEKVGRIFSEQSVLTEQLREQVYRDPVTGLGNRRYFNRQLMSLIGNREDPAEGILLLLEMNGLAKVNETSGYITGDRLLGRTAELINSRLGTMVNCFAARLSGAVFGIVVTGLDRAGAARTQAISVFPRGNPVTHRPGCYQPLMLHCVLHSQQDRIHGSTMNHPVRNRQKIPAVNTGAPSCSRRLRMKRSPSMSSPSAGRPAQAVNSYTRRYSSVSVARTAIMSMPVSLCPWLNVPDLPAV
jgi:GGDEF domain-containing protein